METKEFKVMVPEGYEIDKENSTFECIKFKRIKRFRDDVNKCIRGYYINDFAKIVGDVIVSNNEHGHNMFATKKQAKSALAMARISQIMANDERFGGVVTDEEWNNSYTAKYVIVRKRDKYFTDTVFNFYNFIAFHTKEQRELFVKENMDLIKDYLMID